MKTSIVVVSVGVAAILLLAPRDTVFAVTIVVSGILIIFVVWMFHDVARMFHDAEEPTLPDVSGEAVSDHEVEVLLKELEYHTQLISSIKTWRDAYVLGTIGAYTALAVATIGHMTQITENANQLQGYRQSGGLCVLAAAFVGVLLLIRLAKDRGHTVRAMNAILAIHRRLQNIAEAQWCRIVTQDVPVRRFKFGTDLVVDLIIAALNSVAIVGAAILLSQGWIPHNVCELFSVVLIWFAAGVAQVGIYCAFLEQEAPSFWEEDTV